MNLEKLRMRLSIIVLVSHFGGCLLIIAMFFLNGYTFEEMTTAVGLVAPMFAYYAGVVIKHIIGTGIVEAAAVPQKQVTKPFAWLSLTLPILFALIIWCLCISWAYFRRYDTFEQFKIILGVVEGLFAASMGTLVAALFGK